MKEQEPSGETQVRLNDLTLEELKSYVGFLQRLCDEGQDWNNALQFAQTELQLKIENNINRKRNL